MGEQTRRQFLHAVGATISAAACPFPTFGQKPESTQSMSLGFSLYGMKNLKTEEAIRTLAEIGFDSVELCLIPGWDAAPNRMEPRRRKDIRRLLENTGQNLSALMESVSLSGTAESQRPVHERIKIAAELGHQLKPDKPPLIETTAGSGEWNDLRNQLRDNLGGWTKVAEAAKTVLALKPHRRGVVDCPEHGLWLINQVNSPWIKLNYDYSHFAYRKISLADSIRDMLPHSRFIHVKDTVMQNGNARFMLPGESGQFDYVNFLNLVQEAGYRGDICCEVSAMVFSQKTYDPIAAANKCYRNLSSAFEQAGIQRET